MIMVFMNGMMQVLFGFRTGSKTYQGLMLSGDFDDIFM